MKRTLISSIFILLFSATAFAQSHFYADPNDGRNQATFESDAILENIKGISNKVDVYVALNTGNITSGAKGKVNVDLNVLKTGIDLRDEHLRSEDWLNTSKYPNATFELTSIKNASSGSLKDGQKVNATFEGNFTVHGVTKKVSAPGHLVYYKESAKTKARIAGNLLRVDSEFDIKLSDYDVKVPGPVVDKVNDNITVAVKFIASDKAGKMGGCNPCGACNPCKAKMEKCNPCAAKCNPCKIKKK